MARTLTRVMAIESCNGRREGLFRYEIMVVSREFVKYAPGKNGKIQETGMKIYLCSAGFRRILDVLQKHLPDDEVVECAPEQLTEVALDAEVLIPTLSPLGEAQLALPELKLVQQFGAGLDAVDIAAATRHGVYVANVPAAGTGNAESVAELTLLHMLALARQFLKTQEYLLKGQLAGPGGWTLKGRTAVIVGYGGIGREIARRLQGFEMRVIAVSRSGPKTDRAGQPEDSDISLDAHYARDGLHEALGEADFVLLAPQLNDETRGLMGTREFACLKPTSFVINVSRGGVIDYNALLLALKDKKIAGAGLDVFWQEPFDPQDPLWQYNVIGTPHIGGATDLSYNGIAARVAENIERIKCGELPQHCVNAESVNLEGVNEALN